MALDDEIREEVQRRRRATNLENGRGDEAARQKREQEEREHTNAIRRAEERELVHDFLARMARAGNPGRVHKQKAWAAWVAVWEVTPAIRDPYSTATGLYLDSSGTFYMQFRTSKSNGAGGMANITTHKWRLQKAGDGPFGADRLTKRLVEILVDHGVS